MTTTPTATSPRPQGSGGLPSAEGEPRSGRSPVRVPLALAGATAWSWRLLLVAGAVVALLALVKFFALVALPVAGAFLLCALLHPITAWLRRRAWPRALATATTLLVALVVVGAVLYFAAVRALAGWSTLIGQAAVTTTQITGLLEKVPGASSVDLAGVEQRVLTTLQGNYVVVAQDLMTAATTATEAVTGVIITIFVTFFFLYQGDKMFAFTVRLLPHGVQPSICGAGYRAWHTLTGWVSGTVTIAIIHGIVIGTVLEIVGVDLALPLALVIVLASLLPIVGIIIGGLLAVGVTLLSQGPLAALVVLLAIVVEDQIEAHLLEPFIVGRAVRLHPVVLVLSLAAGTVVGGVVGALLVVPFVATTNAALLYLTGVEDVHGYRRDQGDRTAPMEPPAYAPLPFLGIAPRVAAVRWGSEAAGADDPAASGPSPAPLPDSPVEDLAPPR